MPARSSSQPGRDLGRSDRGPGLRGSSGTSGSPCSRARCRFQSSHVHVHGVPGIIRPGTCSCLPPKIIRWSMARGARTRVLWVLGGRQQSREVPPSGASTSDLCSHAGWLARGPGQHSGGGRPRAGERPASHRGRLLHTPRGRTSCRGGRVTTRGASLPGRKPQDQGKDLHLTRREGSLKS